MNIWALLASLIISWDLTAKVIYHLPTVILENHNERPTATLVDQALDDNKIVPHKKDNNSWGVKISAQASAVMDEGSGVILWQKNADEIRSLASITKLMTALVFLEKNPGWDKLITMQAVDETGENSPNILRSETVTVKDLFYVSLIASDNNTTKALVRSTGLSDNDFVKLMNQKAKDLGLSQTTFVDVTGLDDNDHSTALDIIHLAKVAFDQADIVQATSQASYNLTTQAGRSKKINSTNNLLRSYLTIKAGKTGSTNAAGYCLVARIENKTGQNIIGVVLGSANHEQRFQDLKILLAWILDNFSWS
ncbi:MAG: serine hydrolase [Patescibacteria group bacterium]